MPACAHVDPTRSHPSEVTAALQNAERLCEARGERWTPPRRRVYELLVEGGVAMKAYDLLAGFAGFGQPTAKPATVYRALDFLTAHQLVHRIESLNAFLACRAGHASPAPTFLICGCCGRVEELHVGIDGSVANSAEARGFQIGRAVVEFHGVCAVCNGSADGQP
jgi:Fur family zinc uptake transcriptional regulator